MKARRSDLQCRWQVVRDQLRKGTPGTPNSVASKADLEGDDLEEEDDDQVSDSDTGAEPESPISGRKKSFRKQMSRYGGALITHGTHRHHDCLPLQAHCLRPC